jgi:hypothetical protein
MTYNIKGRTSILNEDEGLIIHFMVIMSFQKPGCFRLVGNIGGGEPGELVVGDWGAIEPAI